MNQATSISSLIGGVSQQAEALRYPAQVEECENIYASVIEGATKRPGSEHIDFMDISMDETSFLHKIDRDGSERYAVVLTPTDAHVYDTSGAHATFALPNYLQSTTPRDEIRAQTVGDYTFLTNRSVTPIMDSAASPVRAPEAMLVCKKVGNRCTYKVKVYDDPEATIPDFQVSLNVKTDRTDTSDAHVYCADQGSVMQRIISDLQITSVDIERENEPLNPLLKITRTTLGEALSSSYEFERNGPYLWLRKNDGTEFKIEVESSLDEGLMAYKDEIQVFTQLPKRGWNDFVIKVSGTPENTGDDYWVKFNGQSEGWCEGVWEEALEPGIQYKIDEDSMPHVLKSTAAGVSNFELETYGWADRLVGDDLSNPAPSFLGEPIENVTWYRNRLTLLAGENSISAESGAESNFWRTTVVDLLDSDPVDIGDSHSRVSIIKSGIPFGEDLMLLAARSQLALHGDDIFASSTARIDVGSNHAYDVNVEPTAVGAGVFFPYPKGNQTGIWEFNGKQGKFFKAIDTTEHVPTYIPKCRLLEGSDSERMLVAVPRASSNYLYVYQWFDSDGDRLQGAWHRWDVGAPVLDVWFVEQRLYVVLSRNGTELTSIDLSDKAGRRLDSQIDGAWCSQSVDDGVTTLTLPTGVFTGDVTLVTEEAHIYDLTVAGDAATVPTDLTGINFVIGLPYVSAEYLTRPLWRSETKPDKTVAGRFLVRYGVLVFSNTRGFSVEVTSPGRDVDVHEWSTATVGQSVLGVEDDPQNYHYRFPVFLDSEDLQVTLKNDTPFPSSWLSLEWEGSFRKRSR